MQQILVILLLFPLLNTHAQEVELKGHYGAGFLGSEDIEFVGKDSFYFNGFYCTYGVRGKGICEVVDDRLYLYFENRKSKPKADTVRAPIIDTAKSTDSISLVRVVVMSHQGDSIPYASVRLDGSGMTSLETIADQKGTVTFRLSKNNYPVTIRTSAVGLSPYQLKLDVFADFNIKLFHKANDIFINELMSGEVFIYKIDVVSEDYILMRHEKSSGPYLKYKRMSDDE